MYSGGGASGLSEQRARRSACSQRFGTPADNSTTTALANAVVVELSAGVPNRCEHAERLARCSDKPDAPPPEYINRYNEFHDHAKRSAAALHAITVRARWVM